MSVAPPLESLLTGTRPDSSRRPEGSASYPVRPGSPRREWHFGAHFHREAGATRPTSGVGGPREPAGRVRRERDVTEMAGQKIRIRLKSYDHEVIDNSARKIVDTVTRAGATVVGPVPLPTEKNVFVVIRSPHKYKDSREQFEMRTHKRLIDIIDPTPKAVDSLMRLDLPADVNIEIKL